jgi:hypothetical protein
MNLKTSFFTGVMTAVALLLSITTATAEEATTAPANNKANDPHYTPAGFFDIHVCNWPDRELFFMPLFSTVRYDELAAIDVYYPDGTTLTSLPLDKYMVLKRKNKPTKRVFMSEIDIPQSAVDGWYTATIKLTDGTEITAKDYVIITALPRVSETNPPDGAEDVQLPVKLSWTPVKEGRFYQVFIRDVWNESKLVYTSKLLDKPELVVPADILEPDGLYSWKVHSRDINEDVKLGDFNKGSMTPALTFSTASD